MKKLFLLLLIPAFAVMADHTCPHAPPIEPIGALVDVLAEMQPGETREISVPSLNSIFHIPGETQPLIAYSSVMPYAQGKMHFMGMPTRTTSRHIRLDIQSMIWGQVGTDFPQPFTGPLNGGDGGGHGYYHQAIASNGDFYWREFGSTGYGDGIQRFDSGSNEWDQTFYGASFSKDVGAMTYSPTVDSVYMVDKGLGLWEFDTVAQTWTEVATGYGGVGLHSFAAYYPLNDSIIFGGGDDKYHFYEYLNGIVTRFETLPIVVSAMNRGVIVAHPTNGTLLLIERNGDGNQGRIWEYNGVWTLASYTHQFYNPGNIGSIFVIGVLPEYNALYVVTSNKSGDPFQFLFKF